MAANEGYSPGNVHFSVRSARPNENLLARLWDLREVVGEPELGQGHAQATGGILPADRFRTLLDALGFSPA
ncbi:MAG: DHH family phosphoesterase [Chloroflexota bacterium]|nr:DHH family phosphoesterase [Chloroflexota bacterium]